MNAERPSLGKVMGTIKEKLGLGPSPTEILEGEVIPEIFALAGAGIGGIPAISSARKIEIPRSSGNFTIASMRNLDLTGILPDFQLEQGKKPTLGEIVTALEKSSGRLAVQEARGRSKQIKEELEPQDFYTFTVLVKGKPQNVLYITRRGFVKGMGMLGSGLILTACADALRRMTLTPRPPPTGSLPPPGVGTQKAEQAPSPAPPEIPTNFAGILINTDYLIKNGGILAKPVSPDVLPQPTPIPVPEATAQNAEALNTLPTEYTAKTFWLGEFDPANPIHVLDYAIAQGARQGTDGGVTYYQEGINGEEPAFSKLALYREKIQNPEVEYIIKEGYPKGLVLRDGAGISIIGRGADGNIVIAFEEYLPRGEKDFFEPRIRLAIVPSAELGRISKNFLPNLKYFTDKPSEIAYFDSVLQSDRTAQLNTVDTALMEMIYAEAGTAWADKFPKKLNDKGEVEEWELHPNPVIRKPDSKIDTIPEGIDITNLSYEMKYFYLYTGKTRSARVFAKDASGNLALIGKYKDASKEWVWDEPGFREVADLLQRNIGVTVSNDEYQGSQAALYSRAVAEGFNLLYHDHAFHNAFGSPAKRDEAVRWAIQNDQVLYMHGPIWKNDLPESLSKASHDEVVQYVEQRAKDQMKYVRRIKDAGGRPPIVAFINEIMWDTWYPQAEQADYYREGDVFFNTFGEKQISEVYKRYYLAGVEAGLIPGQDFRLTYVDFNTGQKNAKVTKIYNETRKAIQQISVDLGISSEQVQLDIGIEANWDFARNPSLWYLRKPPEPTELSEVIQQFRTISPNTQVHLTDVNLIGLQTQEERTQKYIDYMTAAFQAGVSTFTFWWLLKKQRPSDANGSAYWEPQGLFDFSNYRITSEGRKIVNSLLSTFTTS